MRSALRRLGVLTALVAVLTLVTGTAYAGGCHHHPPKVRHVTVHAYFFDQFCYSHELHTGTAVGVQQPGVWWSQAGTVEPGGTVTLTAHAFTKRGVVIDGQRTFSHTFPATPTAESCVPVPVKHARYKLRFFNGCTPARRYVEVVKKHHIAKVVKRHNANRTKWHLTIRADKGALLPGGVRVTYEGVVLLRPDRCHSHPHGS